MNAAIINAQGSPVAPNIRTATDWPEPKALNPGEVLIRTEASALNQMDLWVGRGVPGLELTYPRISGCDACGTIEAIGDGVDSAWHGQRVIVNAAVQQPVRARPGDPPASTLAPEYQLIGEHHHGMHCELFAVPVEQVVAVGDADAAEAAAFGLTFLTAWSMIFTKGHLRPGQSMLITGIGGGVATSALAIAKWMGCPVAVTSRHQWKLDRARELGAECAILDEGQDWSKDIRAWTNKRGVDMAVDSIGKPTHMNCIKSLARGGAFVTPGNTGGPKVESDQARMFWNQLRLLGSTMGTTDELREVTALFRAGRLKPVVDQVFAWSDAPAAWARLESQAQFGKIVLKW
ncbi:MAG: zinc-binding dehydrogenase [Phycisphaerales bacterium]|nr:zinc-binding dehydrogenase [Phycisphaerales bacterium]